MMVFPVGDEPNLKGRPVINYILIGINVAIFVLISLPLMGQGVDARDPAVQEYLRLFAAKSQVSLPELLRSLSAYDLFVMSHGFKPAAPQLSDLFTSMFLHANWMHLAGNMLFLWIYGDNVELHVGRGAYALIYLATGMAATALFALTGLHSSAPLVGASGAISGVMGCYFLWFPRNQVRLLVWFFLFINVVKIPARWVLGFYLVVDNLLPFMLAKQEGGVAYGAHLGGFVAGLGCAAVYNRWGSRDTVVRRASHKTVLPFAAASSLTESFADALHAGRLREALDAYVAISARERLQLHDDDVLALADWLVETGEYEAGLAVLQRFIATHPMSRALGLAHLRAGMVHLKLDRLPAAQQHFLTVLDVQASRDLQEAARSALGEVADRVRARQRLRFN